MRKITLIAIIMIISIALIISISGCTQKIAETMVEKAIENAAAQEGDNIDVDLQSGQVNISDEQGNKISIGGAEVPDDWPSEIPVNKDIQIEFAESWKADDGKMNWNINGTYNGSAEDLYNYYKSELSGWNEEIDSVAKAGDQGATYTYVVGNDTYNVTVSISESEDGTIRIVLGATEK